MFTRGAHPLGPYYAASFLQAKRWVLRFAARRKKQLMGPPTRWSPTTPCIPSFGDPFDILRLPADVRPVRHKAAAVPAPYRRPRR